MFNRTQNTFEVLARKDDGFALRSLANELSEATSPMIKKEEVATEVWERSEAVDKTLQ